jgi:hypothetical protein
MLFLIFTSSAAMLPSAELSGRRCSQCRHRLIMASAFAPIMIYAMDPIASRIGLVGGPF